MMSITQTERETIQDDDEVRTVIDGLRDVLTPKEADCLEPRMYHIETKARELVRSAPASRRDPLAIAAAAVYEALLHLRGSTGIKVTFYRLEAATGACRRVTGSAWSKFFDRSVGLRRGRLELMTVNDSMNLSDMIHVAVTHLRRGVEPITPTITGWFTRVEGMALQLARDLDIQEDIAPEVAALAIIYEAAHSLDGPRVVNLTFGDTMEVCGMSGAVVGKAKRRLFPEKGG